MKNLLPALLKARQAMEPAAKSGKMRPAKTALEVPYSTLSDVLRVIHPALHANGLVLVETPYTAAAEGTVQVEATLYHVESGEFISNLSPPMPVNAANPQAVGSALTYARRYLLAMLFSLEQEDDDGQKASAHPPKRQRQNGPSPEERFMTPAYPWVDDPKELLRREEDYQFSGQQEALDWGLACGVFNHENHVRNAYAQIKKEAGPENAQQMWAAWLGDVARRLTEQEEASEIANVQEKGK